MDFQKQLIHICKLLHSKNFIAACDGNVSFRENNQSIWITPSAKHKGFIETQDLTQIDLENRIISGNPSSERLMHLEIYRACPKAKAVVHAHPQAAVAWSVAHPDLTELPSACLSEVILAVGSIPIVLYTRPGTLEMGSRLTPFLPEHRVLILGRHGAVAWGESLEEAFYGIERLEHAAQTLLYAHMLGGLTELPTDEVRHLKEMRKRLGEKIL